LKNKAVLDLRNGTGPSLQFTENGGSISLPSINDRGAVTYNFGLSAEEGGPNKQGRTDFLSSTNSTLTSLGSQTEILRVKASESAAFERIGRRFKDDQLEKERNSTVLLDNKDKKRAMVPKPKTVVRKVVSQPQPSSSRTLAGGAGHGSSHGSSSTSHPPYSGLGPGRGQPPAPASAPAHRSYSPMSRQAHHHHSAPANNSPSQPPAASHSQMPAAGSRTGFPSSSSSSAPPRPRPQVNTEIMKRPLRERLIHLLAVRPYKKLEILPRMNKDGLKEKEKKTITNLLREVSDCKNNSYELRRSMWNEVSEDWPFYSEQDRVIVRRRKPQNLTPPGSDTSTSSGHSPSSTNPPSPPQITNPLKRTSFYDREAQRDVPAPKKVRVSSYKRPGASSWDVTSKSPRSLLMPSSGVSGDHRGHGVSPRLDMEYTKVEDDSAPNWDKWGKEHGHQPSPSREPAPVTEQHRAAATPQAESPDNPHMQDLVPNRNMDFIAAYTSIVTYEQRMRYKADFNQNFVKYRKLHNVLDQHSKRFAHLESQLKNHQRGSKEFKDVRARIYEEFDKSKSDRVYQDARTNFLYLHDKMAHIKKLVHDYDISQRRLAAR